MNEKRGFVTFPLATLHDESISAVDKMVLLALKSFAFGEKTSSFPSKATIASILGISAKAVQRSFRALEDAGYIAVDKPGGSGAGSTTVYRITDQRITIKGD